MSARKYPRCMRWSGGVMFQCPGCKFYHSVAIDQPLENGSIWSWNNDIFEPTFSPSVHYTEKPRCHSFVTAGKIAFLDDCDHALAGKCVDLPEWADGP